MSLVTTKQTISDLLEKINNKYPMIPTGEALIESAKRNYPSSLKSLFIKKHYSLQGNKIVADTIVKYLAEQLKEAD